MEADPCCYNDFMLSFLSTLLVLSVGWFLHDPVSLLAMAIFSMVIIGAWILKVNYKDLWGKPQTPLYAMIGVYSASAIVNGVNPVVALEGAYQRNNGIIFFAAIALLFAYAASGQINVKLFTGHNLFLLSLIAIAYGFLQSLNLDPLPWQNPYHAVHLTLGNPDFAGAFFGIIAVYPLSQIIKSSRRSYKFLSLLMLGSIFYLAFQTHTLQSLVLIILTILTFLLINYAKHGSLVAKRFRYVLISFICSFPFIILFVLFTNSKLIHTIKDKIYFQSSLAQRFDYWRTGFDIFKSHPVLGVGPDQYQNYSGIYRSSAQVLRDGDFVIPDKAHSVLIDHFANGGFLAGILWLFFVGYIFFYLFRLVRLNLDVHRRIQTSVLGAIWLTYTAQSLVSPDQIVLTTLGYISAGLIVFLFEDENKVKRSSKKANFFLQDTLLVRVLFFLVFISISVVWGKSMSADAAAKKILDKSQISGAEVITGINAWPAPKTTELIAIAIGAKDPKCEVSNVLVARLLSIDRRNSQAWYIRAICLNLDKKFDIALDSIDNALKYDPLNSTYLVAKVKLAIAGDNKRVGLASLEFLKLSYPRNSNIATLERSVLALR